MNQRDLNDLLQMGKLRHAPCSQREFGQLLRAGRARLIDARNQALALESRLDIAYKACNILALAAFRWHGLRPNTSLPLLLLLPCVVDTDVATKKILARGHATDHPESVASVDAALVSDFIQVTMALLFKVEALGPVVSSGDTYSPLHCPADLPCANDDQPSFRHLAWSLKQL
ncbi:MAG TPA: hypothetical protein VI279_13490 [Rhodocyclaceae bacterium]